ncbi:MAG: type pilus assembly protein PilA [Solirubrobacterales bacterium]|jgi:type IV pilus assembly protein PilA|nr:type pilus assembly protein PilA [Solirubrobacterales bacterium]
MVQKFRERSNGEGGFTLVELLVVMLILGLLAAIAIPSFFNQRDKAKDADAKASVRTAQTAIETYATDNDGAYTDADTDALETIEPTLADAPNAVVVDSAGTKDYSLTVESSTGTTFTIARDVNGNTDLTCAPEETGGCPIGGDWG